MRATRALIYKKNIAHNINEIKKNLKDKNTKICVSVKADAYGHGAVEVAKIAVECGIENLAVATVAEGKELRDAGITCNILMFGLCDESEMTDAVKLRLTPFVTDSQYIDLFEKAAKKTLCDKKKSETVANKSNIKTDINAENNAEKFSVHLAVDTGMGRIGCFVEEAAKLAKKIAKSKYLRLGGMCTHFSVADSENENDIEYTQKQFLLFCTAIKNVKEIGINPGVCHCANTAAIFCFPEMQLDMVRPGIVVYGYFPDEYVKAKVKNCNLLPAMTLVSKVAFVKKIAKGSFVSYGRTWKAERDTFIATIPIGYADGIFRKFSPNLKIKIGTKIFCICGRVCMDMFMAEVDESVNRGDEVIIFGSTENGVHQSAEDVAKENGTISYEITTAISKRVPRVFV